MLSRDRRPAQGLSQQNALKKHRSKKSFRHRKSVEGVLSIEVPPKIFSLHLKYFVPKKSTKDKEVL